jgi:hypothetical protein
MPPRIRFGVEGATDVPVAEALIRYVGREPLRTYVGGGKSKLDSRIRRWTKSSNQAPFLVLRDWDRDDPGSCVVEFLDELMERWSCPARVAVRVPVRSVESWLMADHEAFASYFATSVGPASPDQLADPKGTLVEACRRSRSSAIRDDMVPRGGSGRRVGELYEARVIEFGRRHWRPSAASLNSPSLARTIVRLEALVRRRVW